MGRTVNRLLSGTQARPEQALGLLFPSALGERGDVGVPFSPGHGYDLPPNGPVPDSSSWPRGLASGSCHLQDSSALSISVNTQHDKLILPEADILLHINQSLNARAID